MIHHFGSIVSVVVEFLYILYNTKLTAILVFLSTMLVMVMLVIEVMKSCPSWKSGEYYGGI